MLGGGRGGVKQNVGQQPAILMKGLKTELKGVLA